MVKAGGDKATLTFIVITREAVSHEEREREGGGESGPLFLRGETRVV